MKVLVLGSGAREHALAWKLSLEVGRENVYVMPGNGGTHTCATNVEGNPEMPEQVVKAVGELGVGMVVPGGEGPLAAGVRDAVEKAFGGRVLVIGPGREGARLESSKAWAKAFMDRHGVPTARWCVVDENTLAKAREWFDTHEPPYVVKADGLAAGKGTVIARDREEAWRVVEDMILHRRFGVASERVVLEEYIEGRESSLFVFVKGQEWWLLPTAQDYKRAYDGNTGPNTGGMGSVSPGWLTGEHVRVALERVVVPTLAGLEAEGIGYEGFIYFGLMWRGLSPYVLEYNVRLGDPEAQAILPRLGVSLLELFGGEVHKREVPAREEVAVCVVVASEGYPGSYRKGVPLCVPEELEEGMLLFHAGTQMEGGRLVTAGGRVFSCVGLGVDVREARERAYRLVQEVRFEGSFYRRDIAIEYVEPAGQQA